jgi:hypothetical protein
MKLIATPVARTAAPTLAGFNSGISIGLISTKRAFDDAGFQHSLTPLSVGLAAAEFLPADPAVFFDAAARAGISLELVAGRLRMILQHAEPAERNFLIGWLAGTPNGEAHRKPDWW